MSALSSFPLTVPVLTSPELGLLVMVADFLNKSKVGLSAASNPMVDVDASLYISQGGDEAQLAIRAFPWRFLRIGTGMDTEDGLNSEVSAVTVDVSLADEVSDCDPSWQ